MIRQRFSALSQREQQVVLLAAPLVVLLLIWLLLIRPLLTQQQHLTKTVAAKQADLHWMQQVSGQLPSHTDTSTASASTPVRQQVIGLFTQQQISLDRIQSTGADQVSVWSEKASFAALLTVLAEAQTAQLQLTQVQINPTDRPGQVAVRATFAQGGQP